jgi:zinc transporter 9
VVPNDPPGMAAVVGARMNLFRLWRATKVHINWRHRRFLEVRNVAHSSRKIVVVAIFTNFILTIFKFSAAVLTHSASMMNEAVHSLMDTLNQGFLYMGLAASTRPPDELYAFGHGQKKYLWNLWSAIGLFSIGSGLGLAHAWHSFQDIGAQDVHASVDLFGAEIPGVLLSLSVLGLGFLLEGYSFLVAGRAFLGRMRTDGHTNPITYIVHADDPTLVAVVLEDSVAVFGLVLAVFGIGLSALTGNPVWDVAFSAGIAVLLGAIAVFLGMVNMRYLTDIRDVQAESAFARVIREHPEVERFHDLRSIILDEHHTILVAEMEVREEMMMVRLGDRIREIEEGLLEHVPRHRRSDQKVKDFAFTRAAAQATLERTERLVDELEAAVKALAPQVAHVTVEVEGLVPAEVPGHLSPLVQTRDD